MLNRVQQPNDSTCWFAVFSMLTGVPLEALPWNSDDAPVPEIYSTGPGEDAEWTFDQSRGWGEIDPNDTTLADWNEALANSGLQIVEYQFVPDDKPIGVVLYNPVTGWTHVVAQYQGIIYDPSPVMPMPHEDEQFYLKQGIIPVLTFSIEKVATA